MPSRVRIGDTACVVAHGFSHKSPFRRSRFFEDILPHSETNHDVPFARSHPIAERGQRFEEGCGDLSHDCTGRGERFALSALHRCRPGEEMPVVCHIDTVFPGIGITFEPGIVQGGSPTITVGGIIVTARLHPDVRGHVNQVSGCWNKV